MEGFKEKLEAAKVADRPFSELFKLLSDDLSVSELKTLRKECLGYKGSIFRAARVAMYEKMAKCEPRSAEKKALRKDIKALAKKQDDFVTKLDSMLEAKTGSEKAARQVAKLAKSGTRIDSLARKIAKNFASLQKLDAFKASLVLDQLRSVAVEGTVKVLEPEVVA